MRAKEAASLLVVCMFALPTCASAASADDLTEQLSARYQNKVLMLRHFYTGDHLSFRSDGSLVGTGDVGPWTTNGQVEIKSIELKGRSLEIKGRRVCLTYDDTTKSFNDVLEYLEQSSKVQVATHRKKRDRNTQKGPDWDKLKNDYQNLNVGIEIGFEAETPSAQEVSDALTAVFMKPGESFANLVPEFWKDYFDRAEGRPVRAVQSSEPVYRVTPGKVLPPRVVYQPEPEFTEEARLAKYQGIETLSLVVDNSGRPTKIQITSPLGLGLDEKGVDAVSKWKFEPAKKDGKPVATMIAIEIDFHLN